MSLEIRPLKDINEKELIELNVFDEQKGFIESISQCLMEAREQSIYQPVGIYNQGVLIGFAMYGFFRSESPKGKVWLDRFLIDYRFQNKGYGKKALILLLKRLKEEYQCDLIYLSVYEENQKAIHLYKRTGFIFNGEFDLNQEKIMTCKV